MDEHAPSSLGSGLFYEDTLPLRWRVMAPANLPSPHVEEANIEFLRVVESLEEQRAERSEEHMELAHEIQRLESKVNLLLDMVGRILGQSLRLPDPVPVRLNALGLEWTAASTPGEGEHVEIELYLRPEFPRPLMLTGRVAAAAPTVGGRCVTVIFEKLSEALQEWLEKTIFRHHRRLVAHARRQPPAS